MRSTASLNPMSEPDSGATPEFMRYKAVQSESMSDAEALSLISQQVIIDTHESWLEHQFDTRTPWPTRDRVEELGKDGHPVMIPSSLFPLMHRIAQNPYQYESQYRQDLATFKAEFSLAFKANASYFDYLDKLTSQEFRDWIISAQERILTGNTHWIDFVKNLLVQNNIDFSDLVEGKLSKTDRQLVQEIYYAVLNLNRETTIDGLTLHLGIAEEFGIVNEMVKAHENWRKTAYKLENIKQDYSAQSVAGRTTPPHIFTDLNHTLKTLLSDFDNLTANDVVTAIKAFRANYEKNPEVAAVDTFMLIVNICYYLNSLLATDVGDITRRYAVQDALKIMIRIVGMDANPGAFQTVLDIQNKALSKRGEA